MSDVAQAAETAQTVVATTGGVDIKTIMTGVTIMVGGITPAFVIGQMASKAMEATGRNPEAANEIRTSLILSVAFAEAIAIYSLVVALIIKFV